MAIHEWAKDPPWNPNKFTFTHWVWLNRRRMKVGGTVNEQDWLRAYENMSVRIYRKNGEALELSKRDPYRWDHPVYGKIRPERVESLLEVRRVPKKRARGGPDTKRKRTQLSRTYSRKYAADAAVKCHGAQTSQVVTSSFDTLQEIAEAETKLPMSDEAIETAVQNIIISSRVPSQTTSGFRLGAQIHNQCHPKCDEDEWIDVDDDFDVDFEILDDVPAWATEDEYVLL